LLFCISKMMKSHLPEQEKLFQVNKLFNSSKESLVLDRGENFGYYAKHKIEMK
jgi:hypothetical protein